MYRTLIYARARCRRLRLSRVWCETTLRVGYGTRETACFASRSWTWGWGWWRLSCTAARRAWWVLLLLLLPGIIIVIISVVIRAQCLLLLLILLLLKLLLLIVLLILLLSLLWYDFVIIVVVTTAVWLLLLLSIVNAYFCLFFSLCLEFVLFICPFFVLVLWGGDFFFCKITGCLLRNNFYLVVFGFIVAMVINSKNTWGGEGSAIWHGCGY